jgi:hypothetical protein
MAMVGRRRGTLATRPVTGTSPRMELAGRVFYILLWTLVLILAAFIVVNLLHVESGSSLLTADDRIARALASPFRLLDGLHVKYGFGF